MHAILGKRLKKKATASRDDPEAARRKERSERILVSEGIAINPDLPPLHFADDAAPRNKREVAYRVLCVLMTALKAERMEQTMVLRVIRQYGLASRFSPVEKEFIRNAEPADDEKKAFLWRYEAAWALLWALGYVPGLSTPNKTCEVKRAVACMRDHNTTTFIGNAKLRPLAQLLDQADLIERYHWSVTDAGLKNMELPAGLDADVVRERRYAFNWLLGYSDKEWDDIRADA